MSEWVDLVDRNVLDQPAVPRHGGWSWRRWRRQHWNFDRWFDDDRSSSWCRRSQYCVFSHLLLYLRGQLPMGGLATLQALGFTLFMGHSRSPSFPPLPAVPLLLSLPSPLPSLPLPLTLHSPFLPSLRSRPLKYSYGVWGSAVSSPAGLGRRPSGNRIWCILALKSDLWWYQFYKFSRYLIDHSVCIFLIVLPAYRH